MNRPMRFLAIFGVALGAAAVAALADAPAHAVDLVVLGGALVASEQLELRPTGRAALPLSFALVVVLVRAATPGEFVVIVGVGLAVAMLLRPGSYSERGLLWCERLAEGLGAGAVYRLIAESFGSQHSEARVLAALAGAAVTQIVVADLVVLAREHRLAPVRARGADLALVTSGMLMAVGYGGIGGSGRLGLWGPLLFSIPLLAAWYSFELLERTRRSFRQTVRALGVAPELGGLVRPGHVERVAQLAVDMGQHVGLSFVQLTDLETAAWLHHLGAVCLDEPAEGEQHDPREVARAGASMLRASEALAAAGEVVAAEPLLHRMAPGIGPSSSAALAGQILKVASAYDELTEGDHAHAAWAVEALYTGPGYVYDGRVLGALERALTARGWLTD